MPPTTRKTAAKKTTTRKTNTGVTNTSVTRKRPAKKVAEPIVQEDTNVSENVETTEATSSKRKGPKPNPFVAYEKARAKADKARAAYEKVQKLAEAKEQAEREEQEALSALQAAYEAVGVNPGE